MHLACAVEMHGKAGPVLIKMMRIRWRGIANPKSASAMSDDQPCLSRRGSPLDTVVHRQTHRYLRLCRMGRFSLDRHKCFTTKKTSPARRSLERPAAVVHGSGQRAHRGRHLFGSLAMGRLVQRSRPSAICKRELRQQRDTGFGYQYLLLQFNPLMAIFADIAFDADGHTSFGLAK